MTRALWLLGCLATIACSEREARTQIMLEVAIDSAVLDELRVLEVIVHVSSDDGADWQKRVDERFSASDVGGAWSRFEWPARLGLVPGDDGEAPIVHARVTALGARDRVLVVQSAAAAFVRGRTKLLRIELLASCMRRVGPCDDPSCVGSSCSTCRDGRCEPVGLTDGLPDYEPSGAGIIDSGIIDSNDEGRDAGDAAWPDGGGRIPPPDSGGAPAPDSSVTPECGDAVRDAAEECDEGAANAGDANCRYGDRECTYCDLACQEQSGVPRFCGDGEIDVDAAEDCDDLDQNGAGPGWCADDCSSVQECGDGVRQGTEACDDGSNNGQRARCDRSCAFMCVGNCPLRVDIGAPAGGDGLSWNTAIDDLQAAVTRSADHGGGQVWLKQGVYMPAADSEAIALLTIPALQQGRLEIYGGFAGNETRLEQRNAAADGTVLSGASSVRVVWGSGDYLLDGVTIIDGYAIYRGEGSDGAGGLGAGMFNTLGNPTIRNCGFYGNLSYGAGAAMYNEAAYPHIERCRFEDNEASDNVGGAIYIRSSHGTVRIRDSVFAGNDADSYSGSMMTVVGMCEEPDCRLRIELESVKFSMNRTQAIALFNADLAGVDVELTGSTFDGDGSAMSIDALSSAELRRSSVSANLSGSPNGLVSVIANAGRLRVVDSKLLYNETATGVISNAMGATAFLFNTLVLANEYLPVSSFGPSVALANGGVMEIVHCSVGGSAPIAIGGSGSTTVINSAIWPGTVSGTVTHSCLDNAAAHGAASNVELDAPPFDQDGFLLPGAGDACLDGGDALAADERQIPWQQLTTQAGGCLDSGAVDLGVHLPATDGAVPCL